MIITPTGLRLSASDLIEFFDCEHLAWLEREVVRGRAVAPPRGADAMEDLLARKGRDNETAYLDALEAKGTPVARMRRVEQAEAVRVTQEAMAKGEPAIYQATLAGEQWIGVPDFLERIERPSKLGAWSYEVVDTKLSRRTKPDHVIQLSLYTELLSQAQGLAPEHMHVVLDGGVRESFRCTDFGAYVRTLQRRLMTSVAENGEADTYPLPIEHCAICRWEAACKRRWAEDDHLSGVADIRHRQIARLENAGVRTIAALAALPDGARVLRLATGTLGGLRHQARLQVEQRTDGEPHYELLEPVAGRGLALLPAPSPGDVFFDMEGDPFVNGVGLEYLFGADAFDVPDLGGRPEYRAFWGHDRAGERAAFEAFIDFVVERRRIDPLLHVYHYAPYEPSALKRLAGRHGTREAELDNLLRGQVFVDLYRIVRHSLRTSLPGYSIKDIERFYMGPRDASVTSGGDSILAYELWLDTKDDSHLRAIESYNAEDCRSTRLLRDWLLDRREESIARFGETSPFAPEPEPYVPTDKRLAEDAECARLIAALTQGLGQDPKTFSDAERGRWLLAQLVGYHRREERPEWWMYFNRLEMTERELEEDSEAIAGLELDRDVKPRVVARSIDLAFRFPQQESKLSAGTIVRDPATGTNAGTIVEVDVDAGRLVLRRGPNLGNASLPRAIVPVPTFLKDPQREAIQRVAREVVTRGIEGPGSYRALRDLLCGRPPIVLGIDQGEPLQGERLDSETAWRVVSRLAQSALVVQGPPGAGKTYLGGRLLVRLMREGRAVGVTAVSHRAIHNLLDEVERVAHAEGFEFRGIKKCRGDGGPDDDTAFHSKLDRPFINNVRDNPDGVPGGCLLVAGTAWLFSREAMDQSIDTLFVDEAGQVSLADAIAVGTSARNLVLLGDPQQLPQVSQGTHPDGASASVLEHVLGAHDTIPPERGLFLDHSWRMHPDVCRFISELAYDGRLESAPGRERQHVDSPGLSGSGLRYLPVLHTGNSQHSEEEARAIAAEIVRLLEGTFTTSEGEKKPITLDEILIVTPYNAQVQTLRAVIPAGAKVGTVDKFQGREAAVVFYSMVSSSGDDLPRGIEFLFMRNRLNVAVSRARALSVLVASPRLLEIRCRTTDQMRLVNGVCRFVELAGKLDA
ncbi:MAG: TM0106 family RecB-like putative nuclease [Candidatus Eiseniibacteriota bacterium]